MLRAIIFDFDGVVADSEPTHFAVFQRVLKEEVGLRLTEEDYYARYLGFDDKGCFAAVLADQGHPAPQTLVDHLARCKAAVFLDELKQRLVICPGIREFVREAGRRCRLAIASGALRHEIEFVLEQAGIRKDFEHITSAEDVRRGKPDPEGFLHALAALNRRTPPGVPPLAPGDCLVVEDSLPGIRGAHAAGMKVLAVANTHTLAELAEADVAVRSLEDVTLSGLEARLWGRP
ncbi:HAD family hydrolase [Nitrospira sp. Kam-Ns4a]